MQISDLQTLIAEYLARLANADRSRARSELNAFVQWLQDRPPPHCWCGAQSCPPY